MLPQRVKKNIQEIFSLMGDFGLTERSHKANFTLYWYDQLANHYTYSQSRQACQLPPTSHKGMYDEYWQSQFQDHYKYPCQNEQTSTGSMANPNTTNATNSNSSH
ncbi:hypothetical protein [Teredinibacter sp. KSP-S5-2]|uniref:hypothetical protein n=1 Tax=Teredinibacter sp. KSP-S5-2 TaxID=3034506 RepID=UPI0029351A32|nr:hypothetical protein [Teredinibacter sp. KSP-S5-2]WNO11194.1 hypothetical protein P5V12_08415 [Teredinibacter sp. KSP-S5-2]